MAAGNVFQLILNDGKRDEFLYGDTLLQTKIKQYMLSRLNQCIDRTRKWMGNESNQYKDEKYHEKVAAFNLNPSKYCFENNKRSMFQPTLLDVKKTHAVYINSVYKPFAKMAYAYNKSKDIEGTVGFDNTITFKVPFIGQWTTDMVLHAQLTGLSANSGNDKVKYCDMLGHRLIEKVSLEINKMEVASYGTETMNKYFHFDLDINKRDGYLRNIGQEKIHTGWMTSNPSNDEYRQIMQFSDGNQTYKKSHDLVDLWIPMLFWFNTDIAQAFPNGKIPFLRMEIKIKLAPLAKLIAVRDTGGGGAFTAPKISLIEFYSNQIATDETLANMIFAKNYDLSLIRVKKEFTKLINAPHGEIKMNTIKFPVENYAVALRPIENESNVDIWHRNTKLVRKNVYHPIATTTPTLAIGQAYYFTETDTIKQCGLKTSDVYIHELRSIKFYSSYFPHASKGFRTPNDGGWALFNFQFDHSSSNPSGWINITLNAETYFEYTSDNIDDQNRAKMIAVADCINFLIIKKGEAFLRYYK